MKLTPPEQHLLATIQNVKLPKTFRTEEVLLVGDLVDVKILKRIAKELMSEVED